MSQACREACQRSGIGKRITVRRTAAGTQYLGRYTHRVAISNARLLVMENGQVSFRWKDYRHPQRPKVMMVAADEFIRRFLLHTVPTGFQRIRYYGPRI